MNPLPRGRNSAGPARERAFEILLRVETDDAFASRLLDHHERALPDARESALLHEIVLGVLRFRRVLDHVVARVSSRPPAEID
ncbi:MAG: MFS transporter, partial [Acidobacteriota bacterium]|nr:MFS transporter [Acidobacteriota bacterium]